MNKNNYPTICKCEICDKEIELKDRYAPIRYQISIAPNPNPAMLVNTDMYKFVYEECAKEIRQHIFRIKELKTTETQFTRFYNKNRI